MKKVNITVLTLSIALFLSLSIHCVQSRASQFTFILISDTHIGFGNAENTFRMFVSQVNDIALRSRFIVNTGDITEDSKISEFKAYKDIFNLTFPLFSVVGNHDVKHNKTAYETYVGDLFYSFDAEGCHFIALDSTVVGEGYGHVSEDSIKLLRSDLDITRNTTPIIVFSHHPLIGGYCDNGDYVLSLLEPYNVMAFFSGHTHVNAELLCNGALFVSTSSLGKSCPPGYRIVTVSLTVGLTISTEFVEVHFPVSTALYFNVNPNPACVGQNVTLKGILVDEFSRPLSNQTVDIRACRLEGGSKRPFHIAFVTTNNYGIFIWQFTVPACAIGRSIFAVCYLGSEKYGCCCNFAILIVQ